MLPFFALCTLQGVSSCWVANFAAVKTMMAEDAGGFVHRRLSAIPGFSDRVNDIFVFGNATACEQHIIFFGGDVQDYSEKMESHRDNKRYVEWSTEETAKKISHRFSNSVVFVIKPAYMYLGTYASYSNFWATSETSTPVHCENFNALDHLLRLFHGATKQVYGEDSGQEKIPIHIIGFSKGCTVLNQLVFELHRLGEEEELKDFVTLIKSFYWLDGGHNGWPGDTWVTQDAALQHLASLGCDIHIHVTPYQIKNPLRLWVGKEEAKFHKKLKKLKANVHRTVHFETDPRSIENHFCILNEF